MLIIGLRTIWKTLRGGTFHCPNERTDRPYIVQEARRFFAIFFIPLIPLGKAGQAVRCESCKNRFPVSVLDQPTAIDRTDQLARAVRTCAVAMAAADGAADAAVRSRTVDLVNEYDPGYDDAKLREDLRLLPVHDVQSVVAAVASGLDGPGKERFVTDILSIATSNGEMTAAERRVLDALAAGLAMTPAHLRGVLAGDS